MLAFISQSSRFICANTIRNISNFNKPVLRSAGQKTLFFETLRVKYLAEVRFSVPTVFMNLAAPSDLSQAQL